MEFLFFTLVFFLLYFLLGWVAVFLLEWAGRDLDGSTHPPHEGILLFWFIGFIWLICIGFKTLGLSIGRVISRHTSGIVTTGGRFTALFVDSPKRLGHRAYKRRAH